MADAKKSGGASRLVRIDLSLEREPVALRRDTPAISNDGAGSPPLRTPKKRATPARAGMRPSLMSLIHPRALAIAVSRASRLSGLSAGFAQGA